jgi:Peptidase family M23
MVWKLIIFPCLKPAGWLALLVLLSGTCWWADEVLAQGRRGGGARSAPAALDYEVSDSGISLVLPAGATCTGIASAFAARTRQDGSLRPGLRNGGLHGGIDLSLAVGTPLLAVAAGEVMMAGEGGQMEGIFLWLRHAPEDIGLPFWAFSKYQHLSQLPSVKRGERVRAGQVVALSGATGTADQHYGAAGYPHLHLTSFYGPGPAFRMRGGGDGPEVAANDEAARIDDPLILYLDEPVSVAAVRELPAARRVARPGVVRSDGTVFPAGSRRVWPVTCAMP